jgi:hypothetical protein
MNCPNCNSEEIITVPAEVRLYRNAHRTLSHPPMNPSPDIHVCHGCGWSQFAIPKRWMNAGWLNSHRPMQTETVSAPSFAPNLSVAH